ncbi:MAG: galactokinase [Actinomycetota bacterium]|nr:galactokinase [Actinomycetota bacterium]
MGGRSVCVALDLWTTVEVNGAPVADGAAAPEWTRGIWRFLRVRFPGLEQDPPPVRVSSEAPSASGLSSSTSLILALFHAFVAIINPAAPVRPDVILEWAYEFELALCNGGGMDHLAIARGGATLLGGRPCGLPELIGHVDFPPEWSLVVVDSGTPKSTPRHITSVRAQYAASDPVLAEYVERSDTASAAVWDAIRARHLTALTDAMTDAHRAMRDLQRMSTPLLESLRALARSVAGLPLKISGAGGGGALVGVCPAADAPAIVEALLAAYRSIPGVQVIVTGSVGMYS